MLSEKRKAYIRKYYKDNIEKEGKRYIEYLSKPDKKIRALYVYARRRARDKGLEFSITENDVHYIYMRQEGFCAVSDVKLNFDTLGKSKTVLDGISLDRIDPQKGYTTNNIRLVCWAVNAMKYNMSDTEFFEWVEKIHLTKAKKSQIIEHHRPIGPLQRKSK